MRFKVIKYRRKDDKWKYAVIRKHLFRAAEVVVFTEKEEDAHAACACLNQGESLNEMATLRAQ